MFELVKRSGRLAGIYTTYAGVLFGATWLLDRWLVWQIQRTVIAPAWQHAAQDVRETVEAMAGPRCSVWTCDNAPVATVHGWDVCGIHDPREKALPNGQSAAVKGS